ncbi:MAG: ArnT family glycosyltransferase, partial [Vicinamibacteria bacterium]
MKRLLFLVVVIAAVAMSRGIDLPWRHGDHNGWGGAFYSNIARNYLRYGYLETRFAPVINTGKTPPEERRYYLTHPPFIGLAVSLSFRLFGEHEWSARLVPLAFSLGSILLLYRVGSAIASRETGLMAAALFSFAPVEALYGAHVDPQGPPVTFFSLLLLLAYHERRPWLGAGALVLGAGFDWPIHYLAGLLAFHASFFSPDRRRWAFGLLAGSVLLVAAFFLHARLIAPRPDQQYLESKTADAFLYWTGIRVPRGRIPGRSIEAPSLRDWLSRMGSHLDSLFTFPLLALGVFGAAVFGARGPRGYLWILLSWGLLHILLFPLGAYVHDYWSIYLAPGLALAGAAGLEWIGNRLRAGRKTFLAVSSTALAAFLLIAGIHR